MCKKVKKFVWFLDEFLGVLQKSGWENNISYHCIEEVGKGAVNAHLFGEYDAMSILIMVFAWSFVISETREVTEICSV